MLNIKVLGPGCTNCINLEKLCKEIVVENGVEAEIEKITDFKDIMAHGIMSTPGLIINGKIVSSGKLPTKSTLTHWVMNALAESENN
ncbi:MAG: thioredoxin family protein [Ignavibacteria bacterium]|jgi:small redox-active disulfide protein 2|nr:thioredoxin family protein [Ignavibacteria bacterium]MCU7503033.1 thioredoxin family protein [Ignavibacteria bacterium]MCU7516547.1 thioredoxin family protein [Ignavibacteria bacterium]